MNRSVKYAVALVVGVAAVGAATAVALPVLGRGLTAEAGAAVQQVVPTVFAAPDDEEPGGSSTWRLDPDSAVAFTMTTTDGLDVGGRTSEIDGVITRTAGTVSDAEFMVDLATLAGGDPARSALLGTLVRATGGNTIASFVLTEPIALPDEAAAASDPAAAQPAGDSGGTADTVPISGTLTVRGVSNPVVAEAEIRFDDDSGTMTARIPIDLESYGIALADLGVVHFEPTAYIDVDLVASPAD
ncbi:MAG: YceI family protein [Herbiconiux sp.]|nr:YceI family protein [Herbiconiux sp.]